MASEQGQKVQSGNTVFIKMRGQRVGRCSQVNGSDSFGTEGQYEIGDIAPQEHISLRYEARVTVAYAVLKVKPLRKLGISINSNILKVEPFDLEVVDKLSKKVVEVWRNCTQSDGSVTVSANQITTGNATFLAMKHDDNAK